jgi:hypothetical protein
MIYQASDYVIGGGIIQPALGPISPFYASMVIRIKRIFVPIFMKQKPFLNHDIRETNYYPLNIKTSSCKTQV